MVIIINSVYQIKNKKYILSDLYVNVFPVNESIIIARIITIYIFRYSHFTILSIFISQMPYQMTNLISAPKNIIIQNLLDHPKLLQNFILLQSREKFQNKFD